MWMTLLCAVYVDDIIVCGILGRHYCVKYMWMTLLCAVYVDDVIVCGICG